MEKGVCFVVCLKFNGIAPGQAFACIREYLGFCEDLRATQHSQQPPTMEICNPVRPVACLLLVLLLWQTACVCTYASQINVIIKLLHTPGSEYATQMSRTASRLHVYPIHAFWMHYVCIYVCIYNRTLYHKKLCNWKLLNFIVRLKYINTTLSTEWT